MGVMAKKVLKIGAWKRASVAAAGFGLGGFLWGLEAYRGTVGAGESFTNPFSYILGAVALAVFGGIALSYITQADGLPFWSGRFLFSKHTLKIVGIGLIGWLVAFLLPAVWVEWWFSVGGGIISFVILTPFSFLLKIDLVSIVNLKPSLMTGHLWLEFLFTGAIVGFVYSMILKTKILRTVLWSAGGFAVASLVGPILGNLAENLFSSLLVSYILTFVFVCAIIGACVYGGIYGSLKKTPSST